MPVILHRVPEVLVRARGLTKRFGSFTAVDGVDFDLFQGEAFGFLGPNGARKSSTMRMIGCVSPSTLGELTIFGADPVRDGAAMTCTTFMKSWQDFGYVIVECTPLYQGVVLLRGLVLGAPGPGLLWRAGYLAAMGVAGLLLAGRRIARLLLI
jgi:ABC-type phosphate/phosphonate transport system ATPase subunit